MEPLQSEDKKDQDVDSSLKDVNMDNAMIYTDIAAEKANNFS